MFQSTPPSSPNTAPMTPPRTPISPITPTSPTSPISPLGTNTPPNTPQLSPEHSSGEPLIEYDASIPLAVWGKVEDRDEDSKLEIKGNSTPPTPTRLSLSESSHSTPANHSNINMSADTTQFQLVSNTTFATTTTTTTLNQVAMQSHFNYGGSSVDPSIMMSITGAAIQVESIIPLRGIIRDRLNIDLSPNQLRALKELLRAGKVYSSRDPRFHALIDVVRKGYTARDKAIKYIAKFGQWFGNAIIFLGGKIA